MQTSIAAAYMLYALARHPDVQQRLREEVLAVVGPSATPNSQHLQKLQYAKSIITETMRCVCMRICVCLFVVLIFLLNCVFSLNI